MYSTLLESKYTSYYLRAGIRASLFCFILALTSCGDNEKVVASVGEVELTESDAYVLMKHQGIDPKDDERYREFLQNWCENEALKAEMKLEHPEDWALIRLRTDAFAGDLSRLYLEEALLKKDLDTVVSNEEIEQYYTSHKEEFILQDYIVKALYFKIPVETDFKSDDIQTAFLLKNDKDLIKVNSYAKLYAENYHFNDSSWVYFSEIAKDIPVTKYNVDNLVLNRSKTYFSDDQFTYFINIMDFKLKDEAPPMEFLRNEIKNIIVAQRLQDLIEKNETKLIERIKAKHEITIHI